MVQNRWGRAIIQDVTHPTVLEIPNRCTGLWLTNGLPAGPPSSGPPLLLSLASLSVIMHSLPTSSPPPAADLDVLCADLQGCGVGLDPPPSLGGASSSVPLLPPTPPPLHSNSPLPVAINRYQCQLSLDGAQVPQLQGEK